LPATPTEDRWGIVVLVVAGRVVVVVGTIVVVVWVTGVRAL
jgi:hypothetical protein